MVKLFSLCIFCLMLVGCSVHPSQQDVSHRPTREIVEQVLCETRIAIIDEAKVQLRESRIPGSMELADKLGRTAEQYERLSARDLVGDEKRFYKEYADTGIAFDFTLDAMEENTASTQIDFLRLISNGTASLSVSASNDLSRDSTRSFLVTRQFDALLKDRKLAAFCETNYIATPNLEYPVSGAIGIADVIHTFIDLNEGPKLETKKDSPNVYTDKLTFITTIMGSVVPKVVLTPPTRAFHLTDASLTNTELRKDNNILTIGLAFAPHAVARTPEGPRIATRKLAPAIGLTPFARAGISVAEDRAVEAIYQQRQNLFLDRSALTLAR